MKTLICIIGLSIPFFTVCAQIQGNNSQIDTCFIEKIGDQYLLTDVNADAEKYIFSGSEGTIIITIWNNGKFEWETYLRHLKFYCAGNWSVKCDSILSITSDSSLFRNYLLLKKRTFPLGRYLREDVTNQLYVKKGNSLYSVR